MLQKAIRTTVTVEPGGQVVITHPLLLPGQTVEVLILLQPKPDEPYQSAIDILNSLPGHQLFKSAAEVDQYLREDRDSWDS
ncbi:MAG: hypothetical protein IPH95_05115 [Candidatus Promineofilum sp.]|nr:hypothetical protein [Promineifilum sp.]